jgi:ABC-2 type transport system permease protein
VAVAVDAAPHDDAPVGPDGVHSGRPPRAVDFVRLKLRLLRNGFRGQPWRVVGFVVGVVFAVWVSGLAGLGFAASGVVESRTGFLIASLAGGAIVLGWALIPLLFFGVDETLDPARFALLPVPRATLARGMLAAAYIGVPAAATVIATSGLVVAAWIRSGPVAGCVEAVGVVAGLTLGVVASRAITSAFAALLRSRRVRDLAAVVIAVLASSVGPAQLVITSSVRTGSIEQAARFADVVSWTPVGAPYVLSYDVGAGRWLAAVARLALTLVVIAGLLWWWSRTIESAMLDVATASAAKPGRARARPVGAVASLIPAAMRPFTRPTVFGAILARESRFWWRDPRRRASLVSILMASAVLPLALNFASTQSAGRGLTGLPFSFAVTMSGTMGGMLLGNQFSFDGTAFATHLLGQVSGRLELRARAVAVALVAVPVQACVVVAVAVVTGRIGQVGAGLGMLAAGFGAAIAAAALLSVLAPYALPENANPFVLNSGGAGAKGFVALAAMIGTVVVCLPVIVAGHLFAGPISSWLVLPFGLGYGILAARVGTHLAGRILERRGPEVLLAVTPRR